MRLTKIGLWALVIGLAFAYCRKDLGYTIRQYDNSYLYGDSMNTWYPSKIVRSHKKTVLVDTTPVYKTVAVFVNNDPDTSHFKIRFTKQQERDIVVDYEVPDSMAHLLRVPKKGTARLEGRSIRLEGKYMAHNSGDMFHDKTYTVYNKDSIIETEEVDIAFR